MSCQGEGLELRVGLGPPLLVWGMNQNVACTSGEQLLPEGIPEVRPTLCELP